MVASITHLPYLSQSRVRVFHGPQALGNIARCFILSNFPISNASIRSSVLAAWRTANARTRGETWCLLWREPRSVRVVALQHGREIQFCGHGLVAAGYCWFRAFGELAVLATSHARYTTRHSWRKGRFSIAAARFDTQTLQPCRAEKTWFAVAPQHCFRVGEADGYLVCVWPRGIDIAALDVNYAAIALQSRAIVMTQCNATSLSHSSSTTRGIASSTRISCATATATSAQKIIAENNSNRMRAESAQTLAFDLRYLAPQYGNREDQATGSAAAIAANYWHLHFQASSPQGYIATQRSRGGGKIYCTIEGGNVWIGGRVKLEPCRRAREIALMCELTKTHEQKNGDGKK